MVYICAYSKKLREDYHIEMDIKKEESPIAISTDIVADEVKREISKGRVKQILFITAGSLALILAILGIVVPGLPCTPFALLSAAMFAKSSEKLYNKLLNSKILGARIRDYNERKGVTKSGKVKVLVLMWTMVLISAFLIIKVDTIKYIILGAGVVGAIVVWFFVPEGVKDKPNE